MSAQPVDVLAVIRAAVDALPDTHAAPLDEARAAVAELIEAAARANKLVRLLTVRQVIQSGDEVIEAAGLNPWCINEGLADGSEHIGFWRLDSALARCGGAP